MFVTLVNKRTGRLVERSGRNLVGGRSYPEIFVEELVRFHEVSHTGRPVSCPRFEMRPAKY
jgi:hypothetical protein